MFRDLADFGLKRSIGEALVFYVAYLVLFILSGGLIAGLVSSFTNSEGVFQLVLSVVNFSVALAVIILSYLIAKGKKLLSDFRYLGLILLAGIFALWGGGFLGLIIPAFLTTRPKEKNAPGAGVTV